MTPRDNKGWVYLMSVQHYATNLRGFTPTLNY